MGFFSKAWNWVRGKGFQEDEPVPPQAPEVVITPQDNIPEQESPPERRTQPPSLHEIEQEGSQTPTRAVQQQVSPKVPKEVNRSKQEIKQAVRTINNAPTRKEIEDKINVEGVNRVHIQGDNNDLGHLHAVYSEIFTKDAKISDPQILDILIRNREQLKHRFTAEFILYDETGEIGRMVVPGILAEHTGVIDEYLKVTEEKGVSVEYLRILLETAGAQFKRDFGANGDAQINIQSDNRQNIKVTRWDVDLTFA